MGNALVRAREYQRAIEAYRQALAEDPKHAAARQNLRLTETILAYLVELREQEDHGEQTELGADEIRFDNKEKRGATITLSGTSDMTPETEEAWMRTVDPGAAEFLRLRFAIEDEREPRR